MAFGTRWMIAALCGLVSGSAGTGCAATPAFACESDAECGEGRCELSTGFCSFPAADCGSGFKYGAHAPTGVAGQCVDPPGGSGDGSGDGGGTGPVVDDGAGPGSGDTTSSAEAEDTADSADVDTGDPSGSTTSIPPSACEADASCEAAAPPGWNGPTLVVTADLAVPDCPAEVPVGVALGHAALAAPPATCVCLCDPDEESCPNVTLQLDTVTGMCDAGVSVAVSVGECEQLPIPPGSASATLDLDALQSGGSCDITQSTQVTPATWGSHVRACEPSSADGCDDGGRCLPVSADTRVCIVRTGDEPCPAGPYSDRTVVHGDYVDDRDCSDCSCEVNGQVCRVEIRDGTECNGAPSLAWSVTSSQCVELFDVEAATQFTAEIDTTDNCSGAGGDPIGAATPIEPTTLCCVP